MFSVPEPFISAYSSRVNTFAGKPFSFPSEISVMLSNTVDELCKSFKAIATAAVNLSLHIAGRSRERERERNKEREREIER